MHSNTLIIKKKKKKLLIKTNPLIFCPFFISKYTLISSSAEGNYFPEKTDWSFSKIIKKWLTGFFPRYFAYNCILD